MTTRVPVELGGTGAGNAADARNNLGVPPSAAYDAANSAYTQANSAYGQANSAYTQANSAYGQANSAYTQANSAYTQANSAYSAANSAANTVKVMANSGSIINSVSLNFVNTATVNVSVTSGTAGNANIAFIANVTSGSGSGATVYAANVGDGSATSYVVAHNLNKTNTVIYIIENSTKYIVYPDIALTNANAVTLTFVDAPTSNQYFATVLGF